MGELIPLFLAMLFVAFMIWFRVDENKSCKRVIHSWAKKNAYEIVHLELKMLNKGPFFLRSTRSQNIYHVILKDGSITKEAYIRYGSFFMGTFSDKLEVKWVGQPQR